ncbi:MAG: hypothetical protein ACK5N6_18350 [Microcystis sp.]
MDIVRAGQLAQQFAEQLAKLAGVGQTIFKNVPLLDQELELILETIKVI